MEDTVMSNVHARLAHVGVYAHDKPLLEKFYTTVLGLLVTDKGAGRSGVELTFLSGNSDNHHQLVLVSGRPDTEGFNPIQQISFMVDSLSQLRETHNLAL
jgi:catechol 2,3-dioxygenase